MSSRKTIWKHWIIFIAFAMIAAACGGGDSKDAARRKMPDMNESSTATTKSPMGLYTARHIIEVLFPNVTIENNSKSFETYFKKYSDEYFNDRHKNMYAVIASSFYPNSEDVDAMADYVSQGNTLFVAANYFDETFLDKFHLSHGDEQSIEVLMGGRRVMRTTGAQLADTALLTGEMFKFFYYPFTRQISRDSSFPSQVLAKTDKGSSTAIIFKYGSGRIIVAANAHAFTNYFLLTKNNAEYLTQLLAYAPDNPPDIVWDVYYNKLTGKRNKDFSSFGELMKHPPLAWAFWLTLLGALLLIAMGLIRRQRMIPIIKPNVNSSIEFGETVARLYLLKKDNKNIAVKMITYFLEQVRSKYYISTGTLNHDFALLLTAKSGVPIEKTQLLLRTIEQIQNQETVSDFMLLDLNTQLNQYSK